MFYLPVVPSEIQPGMVRKSKMCYIFTDIFIKAVIIKGELWNTVLVRVKTNHLKITMVSLQWGYIILEIGLVRFRWIWLNFRFIT